jgi:hypothetical protein
MRVKSVDGIDARRLPIDKDAGAAISGNHLPSLHFSPETESILALPEQYPVACHRALGESIFIGSHRDLFIIVVLAWPMMSLQQLSNQPDTTSRHHALPVVRALPVNRRRAEHFISGTPLELDGRPVLVTGLFSYMTRLRRGAKLTWQTKCLSTRPMKRRRA